MSSLIKIFHTINFHLITFTFRASKKIKFFSLMHGIICTGNDDPVTR